MRLIVGSLIAGLAFAAAVVAGAQTTAPKPAPPSRVAPKPGAQTAASIRTVATTKQLMHIITIPASDAVFKAAGDPPRTDEGWGEVRDRALAVAESGTLLMVGSRVVDRTSWLRYSRAMVDAAASAAKAADARNAADLSMASDALYDTCETCHAKYLKK